jgi:hypothetical protein
MSIPFDDVETPSVLVVETAASGLDTPAAGEQRIHIDPTTHHLGRKDASANVVDLEVMQNVGTSSPATPINGTAWFIDDGGTPATVSVYYRKGGVTYGPFPLFTLA